MLLKDCLGHPSSQTPCSARNQTEAIESCGEKCAVLERLAVVEGGKVHIIHGLNISHKELIYLLQKSTSY